MSRPSTDSLCSGLAVGASGVPPEVASGERRGRAGLSMPPLPFPPPRPTGMELGVEGVWRLQSFLGVVWSCRLLDGVERRGLFSRRA